MTKKQIGRCIAFALVVCLLLLLMCEIFELSDTSYIATRFKTFDNLNEDSLDAVWIGTSGVDRYWIAAKAYEEYGMTVYPLASDAMPTWLFINVIEEALEKQNPELIIIDVRTYGQSNNKASLMETRARRVLDAMDFFSVNRFKAAFKTMKTIQQVTEEKSSFDLSLLLSYIKYHTMWGDEDFSISDNISRKESDYMGFFMHKSLSTKPNDHDAVVYDPNYYKDLDPIAEASLYELLDYVEEKGLKVLFVDTPELKGQKEIGFANSVFRILDKYGVDYINYSETDADGNFLHGLDLDPDHDFYNENHVNYYGAEKFTAVVSAYLDETYNFEDRRSDEAVAEQWDGIYNKIKKQIKKWEK